VADTLDLRFKHLRSHSAQKPKDELAPDQQTLDLEPLIPLDTQPASSRSVAGHFSPDWAQQACWPVLYPSLKLRQWWRLRPMSPLRTPPLEC